MGTDDPRARIGLALTVAAVVLGGIAFVVAVAPWATEGPGYSLDGFNVGLWGQEARAAVDDPIGSRLGGRLPSGYRYANHPPLTGWSTAVATALFGEGPVVVRGPVLLATIAALAALAALLRDAGLDVGAVIAGVAVTATSGMLLTYGAMLDTPMVSLPYGLGVLWVGQRAWQGRPPSWRVAGALAALAGVAGWQAILTTALVVAVCLLVPAARRTAAALGGGLALGVGVTVAWIVWVTGDLAALWEQAGVRAGEGGPPGSWWTIQERHLTDLYGPVLLGVAVAGSLVALLLPIVAPRGTGRRAALVAGPRPLVAVLAVSVLTYAAVFRNGAAVHDYWTYWGVALVGVAAAALVQGGLCLLRHLPRPVAVAGWVVLAAVVGAVVVTGWTRETTAERRIRHGLDLLTVVDHLPEASDPTTIAAAVYRTDEPAPWLSYHVRGRVVSVGSRHELDAVDPSLPVLLILRGPPPAALRERADVVSHRFAVLSAGDLIEYLEG